VSTPQQAPFLDAANPLLAVGPAQVNTGTVDIPGAGRLGCLTIRTASTTQTVFLNAADLEDWAEKLTELVAAVRAAVLVRPSTADIGLLRNGRGAIRPPGA
jgi:hypothetical protein